MEKNLHDIKVAKVGEDFFIKINGEGTLDNSFRLKDFFRQMMVRGFKKYTLCMEDCPCMDSTFLGVLIGISLRLKEKFDTGLKLTGVHKYNLDLLTTLSVAHLFNISCKKISFATKSKSLERKKDISTLQMAKHIKKAHGNLIKTGPICKIKFIDVQKLLSKEIKELKYPS